MNSIDPQTLVNSDATGELKHNGDCRYLDGGRATSWRPVPHRGLRCLSITRALLSHDSPHDSPHDSQCSTPFPHNPYACWALVAAPFRNGAELARFCSGIFRALDLCSSAVPMLIAMLESCFEFLHTKTVRMLVNACALSTAKIITDEELSLINAAEVLNADVAQLRAAEHLVIAVLLRTSHPSGQRIAPTKYARPLLGSYAMYNPACDAIMREIAATHIACSWRKTLAVRMLLERRAERVATQPATNKLAAKLAAASQLAAAITMQRA